jgi:transposase InsO family protein
VHPRPYTVTTVQDAANSSSLVDLVGREFVLPAKDQPWYGDITYIFTMSGWVYLATVIDGYSRRVVGWAVGDPMRKELVMGAVKMAIANRELGTGEVVFHSDRGSSIRGAGSVTCASRTASSSRSGIPAAATITQPPSRGTRRLRRNSFTCTCGTMQGMSGRRRSGTSKHIIIVPEFRRGLGICRQQNMRLDLTEE